MRATEISATGDYRSNLGADQVHADLQACAALLRSGSRTFALAARALPRQVRDAATVVYAFCRVADDAIDLQEGGAAARGATHHTAYASPREPALDAVLAGLHARLRAAYDDAPHANPVDRALARVVAQYQIPCALFEALLEGFAWDASGRQYETLDELTAYAARVAGTVGAIMAVLMGARAPDDVQRACDLGVAMQFTNIARDVGEDARAGRLYLPRQWLRESAIDPDVWLARPHLDARVAAVIESLLAAADTLYERAAIGIAALPPRCRPAIHAARLLYREIGEQVRRNRHDSLHRRASVSPARKAWLLARAVAAVSVTAATARPADPAHEFSSATRFLVALTARSAGPMIVRPVAYPAYPAHPNSSLRWWRVDLHINQRLVRLIDLLTLLEQRERMQLERMQLVQARTRPLA